MRLRWPDTARPPLNPFEVETPRFLVCDSTSKFQLLARGKRSIITTRFPTPSLDERSHVLVRDGTWLQSALTTDPSLFFDIASDFLLCTTRLLMPLTTSASPRPSTLAKMEDRKRPAISSADDIAPPSKRVAVNGSKAKDDPLDTKEESWVEVSHTTTSSFANVWVPDNMFFFCTLLLM
jgi:hypothetical protein